MNLGYGAYLALYELCSEAFPDISEMTIAKMVAGIDVVALRPDDELKRLAIRAVELGVGAEVRSAHDEPAANERACGHDGRRAMAGRLPRRPRTRGSASPTATGSITIIARGSTTPSSRSR